MEGAFKEENNGNNQEFWNMHYYNHYGSYILLLGYKKWQSFENKRIPLLNASVQYKLRN